MRVVAVIYGGPSLEHEISVASGMQVLEHLDRRRYRPLDVCIGSDGAWSVDGTVHPGPLEATLALRQAGCEVVFPALHGPFGEDGTIQGFFQTIGMPFVGSDLAGSSLAADKIRAKRLLAQAGIEVAPDLLVPPADAEEVRRKLGYPVMVKDPFQGSTLGLRRARDRAEFEAAVEELAGGCPQLLVERVEVGRELTGPVLETVEGQAECLPLVEIRAPDGFFDFEAKYSENGAEEIVPAPVDESIAEPIREISLQAHRLLGQRGMSRSDFIVRPDGEPVYLETNSIPGLTSRSLLPQAAAAAGIEFPDLLTRLIENAVRR
jgi:D-alanine-D-alanine ligase